MESLETLTSAPVFYVYLFAIITYFAFLLPYFPRSTRSVFIDLATIYRPASVLALLASCIAFIAASFTPILAGSVAKLTVGLTIAFATLEIRSLRTKVTKGALYYTLVGFVVAVALVEGLRISGLDTQRFISVAVFNVGCMAWMMKEVFAIRDPLFAKYGLGLLSMVGISVVAMIVMIIFTVEPKDGMLYSAINDTGVLLVARMATLVTSFLILFGLSAYYTEKLWRRELQAKKAVEEKFVTALANLASARDNETGNHILRTKNFVRALAEKLQYDLHFSRQLRDDNIRLLFDAAPLHDIGKIGIPDRILLKPGRLSADEWEIMKTHTSIGEQVLAASSSDGVGSEEQQKFLEIATEIAGSHHEHWDGSGYPRGLKGEEIPLSARLMAVADTYDAVTSNRPYKDPWPHERAVEEIVKRRGGTFDPRIVDAFLAEADVFKEIARKFRD